MTKSFTVSIPWPGFRSVLQRLAILALVGAFLVPGLLSARKVFFPTYQEFWFNRMVHLALAADREYDKITEKAAQPTTWRELDALTAEIIYQINEEGASPQLVLPTVGFGEYGPGARSGVAGYYIHGQIVLNVRYLTPSWADKSWLSVLVHELVHAQGYFVGDSYVLEAQTETIATEVVAAMANLNYPGARADLLDGIRRDALSMAFYIAKWNGMPMYSTYATVGPSGEANDAMLAMLAQVRATIFTPTELTQVERRLRWWTSQPDNEYYGVLARYVVKVLTPLYEAACSDGVLDDSFKRYVFLRNNTWGAPQNMDPLVVDDFAYVLHNELGVC